MGGATKGTQLVVDGPETPFPEEQSAMVMRNEESKLVDTPGVRLLCDTFTQEQIEFICHCLCQWDDGSRLVHLFSLDPRLVHPPLARSSPVLKAYLFALFHARQFEQLFRVMIEGRFDKAHHDDLAKLWFAAHYEEERQRKHKDLVPVDKYRIRKKFPPPKSVWDGDELVYSFRRGDRKILREYYERHKYPSAEQKREISRRTGLTMIQIANWFKNRRQREKTGSGEVG